MKNFTKKLLALGLTLTLVLPVFTACSANNDRDKIPEDAPWFDVTKITVGDDIDESLYDYVYTSLAGTTDDELIYFAQGYYKMPDDFDWDTGRISDYMYSVIKVYDYDCNELAVIDIMEVCSEDSLGNNVYIESVEKQGDEFVVNATAYSDDWADMTNYQAVLDMAAYELSSFYEVDEDAVVVDSTEASYEKTCQVGDYSIKTYWVYGEDASSYLLLASDSEGNNTIIDLREDLPREDIYDISSIIDMGDGTGLILATTSGYADANYYIIDTTNDFSIEECEEDMSWLEDEVNHIECVDGYGAVVVNQSGIYDIDMTNHTFVSILDFNYTNANRYDINGITPVAISEGRVILSGYNYQPSISNSSMGSCIYVFDRADSNPNAGKTILTLASLKSMNYSICDSICRFNDSNEDFFIQIDTSYNLDKYMEDNDEEDYNTRQDNAARELGNQLSIDILSGVGPDIIIDGASFSQLNNDDYLIDLSEYVESLDSGKFFTNIFDASRTGDCLFQLPTTFSIEGIVTDASNVPEGQAGFTYEQYAEFVDEVCNGNNPFAREGQVNLFIQALSLMPDIMYSDGEVNYDNEAFVALAEYVRDYVNNNIENEGYVQDEAASVAYIMDMNMYMNNVLNGTSEKVLLGLPTYDGRGPVIDPSDSVAVAAFLSDEEEEACLEFVSYLLDDSVQYLFGVESGLPVNRDAFTEVGEDYIDRHNYELEHYYSDWTDADFREYGMSPNPIEYSKIEELEDLVANTSSIITTDGAINAIIREEIPAFFEGDKTLDQIIVILENRVRTLLDERG